MQIYSLIGSALTVVSFALFIGIVVWAWSKGRKQAFDAAALAPFALPDDLAPRAWGGTARPSSSASAAEVSRDSPTCAAADQGVGR
ncbi:MAG TPA: CcoQ/FixQ family Cbb3-type cytochrome c oxidase assembly chaperone [Casimicrobiaceae bacterium]|nr:CcoQ/FixQ family Cbb3-type cytochrome c oxidase assembly chaperone [Casimicrobiaceae bacterium]